MNKNIEYLLKSLKVGAKQSHKNMTLYCLLSATEAEVDFITLDEALSAKALTITELDESGSVPELKVVNDTDNKILMLDGEELIGAKQNRVLNVTVLLAEQSETIIPVSCIEQGRWSYRSFEFESAGRTISPGLKKKKTMSVGKNVMSTGSFAAAQGLVWQEISAKFERMKAEPSPTMAFSDLYDAHQESSQDYLKSFSPVDYQIGVLVFIDEQLAGVEILDKFEIFRKNHQKLVQSYVLDALETAERKAVNRRNPTKAAALKVLEDAQKGTVEKRDSVALGQDVRLESESVVGAGLEYEGQVVQLTLFQREESGSGKDTKTTMSRASWRRDLVRNLIIR